MNAESVVEFLGGVILLQRLPSSSIRKIAQLIKLKHFDEGEFVIRNGESEGVYFILEGEAEVCGISDEDIRPEFVLKRYDYFGDGAPTSQQQADVIALTKVNLFKGITLPYAIKFGKLYGGQFIGHALAAASKTVDCLKIVHHLQAYFLLVGDCDVPILYEVHRLRDGKSFATRRVDAIQKGNVVFTLLASFQKEEDGFEHQEAVMPQVPAPDTLLSIDKLRERRIIDPRLPRTYRNKVATTEHAIWPIDIRFCDPNTSTNQTKSPARLRYWFKAKGKLSDDQALHRCVVAYASDLMFFEVTCNPHRRRGLKFSALSLNHTIWFHRPVKADDWLLFVMESPTSSAARGLVSGQMFNKNGELVVTLVQEGLIRAPRAPQTVIRAKY
ncbi:hypothetical protein KSS87_006019 [Heliosperma pusillum]|nr:hypothetical protein KSS87_006019 [Heliosperma pusillum]